VGALTRTYAGSITGEVKFTDVPPNLAPINVTKDQDYCGQALPNETYLISLNSGLRNVVVFIEESSIKGVGAARRKDPR